MDLVRRLLLVAVVFATGLGSHLLAHERRPPQRLILAHYMPWYVAKPQSNVWGWHWTMNHFDPEKMTGEKRAIASHFYPLIGPYDSSDPHVLEYHLLLMKLAGIDGVIVDWYGLEDFNDYAILHRNTQQLIDVARRLRMRVAICYEDQTIPRLVKGGRLAAAKRVDHAADEIRWLREHWFKLDHYVHLDGKPVLLSFGHAGLKNDEWTACLEHVGFPVSYFSEHHRRDAAVGGFDWPIPKQGVSTTAAFLKTANEWPRSIPVAFPRFVDVYEAAQLHAGYGRIEDDDGATFRLTLERALRSRASLIQVATWNDWGEGTMIEPSREYGYRDLEVIQVLRRKHVDERFQPLAADLRLPQQLLARRRSTRDQSQQAQLDEIARLLATGKIGQARDQLSRPE